MTYGRNVILALDCLLNALTGGHWGATFSMRAAASAHAGARWAIIACAVLSFLIECDHCQRTLDGRDTVGGAAIKAALLILAPIAGLFAVAYLLGRFA